MITMVSGVLALIFFNAEIPSNFGIRISSRTRSKRSFSTNLTTSSPLEANETLYPSFLSMISRNSLMLCSSSATKILSLGILFSPLLGRQEEAECRSLSYLALHPYRPIVVFDDFVNDGQPQARSGFLRRIKGLKAFFPLFLRDAA